MPFEEKKVKPNIKGISGLQNDSSGPLIIANKKYKMAANEIKADKVIVN